MEKQVLEVLCVSKVSLQDKGIEGSLQITINC